jgi:hypothetical protein
MRDRVELRVEFGQCRRVSARTGLGILDRALVALLLRRERERHPQLRLRSGNANASSITPTTR